MDEKEFKENYPSVIALMASTEYFTKQNYIEAINVLKEYLQNDPSHDLKTTTRRTVWHNLSILYILNNDYNEALTAYVKSLEYSNKKSYYKKYSDKKFTSSQRAAIERNYEFPTYKTFLDKDKLSRKQYKMYHKHFNTFVSYLNDSVEHIEEDAKFIYLNIIQQMLNSQFSRIESNLSARDVFSKEKRKDEKLTRFFIDESTLNLAKKVEKLIKSILEKTINTTVQEIEKLLELKEFTKAEKMTERFINEFYGIDLNAHSFSRTYDVAKEGFQKRLYEQDDLFRKLMDLWNICKYKDKIEEINKCIENDEFNKAQKIIESALSGSKEKGADVYLKTINQLKERCDKLRREKEEKRKEELRKINEQRIRREEKKKKEEETYLKNMAVERANLISKIEELEEEVDQISIKDILLKREESPEYLEFKLLFQKLKGIEKEFKEKFTEELNQKIYIAHPNLYDISFETIFNPLYEKIQRFKKLHENRQKNEVLLYDIPAKSMYEKLLDFSKIFENQPKIENLSEQDKYVLHSRNGNLKFEIIEKKENEKIIDEYDFLDNSKYGEKGILSIDIVEESPEKAKLIVKNEIKEKNKLSKEENSFLMQLEDLINFSFDIFEDPGRTLKYDIPINLLFNFLSDFSNMFKKSETSCEWINDNECLIKGIKGSSFRFKCLKAIKNEKLKYQYEINQVHGKATHHEKGFIIFELKKIPPGSVELIVKNIIEKKSALLDLDSNIPFETRKQMKEDMERGFGNFFDIIEDWINYFLPQILAKQVQTIVQEKSFDSLTIGNYKILEKKLTEMDANIDELKERYFEVKAPLSLESLECSKCGAPINITSKEETFIVCEFCKTPFLMNWQP